MISLKIPYNVEIQELAAESVARVADEVAYVVLNGNYALQAGFSVAKDALAYEKSDSEAAKTYVNVIAVKEGNEESEAIKALVDTLKSDEIKDFINEKYDGAVIPLKIPQMLMLIKKKQQMLLQTQKQRLQKKLQNNTAGSIDE